MTSQPPRAARDWQTGDELTPRSASLNQAWVALWVAMLGAFVVLLSGLFLVMVDDVVEPGLAGLTLNVALLTCATLQASDFAWIDIPAIEAPPTLERSCLASNAPGAEAHQ